MNSFNKYNPDVLSCLANLSNDEVFTSPKSANKMLDLLPSTIWRDENATFLDPVCKTGVFLREITKRLIVGLESKIPSLEKRINHILKKQIFGLAITELTALTARRTVYCSKTANGEYSLVDFENSEGNIFYDNIKHIWQKGICTKCGAKEIVYNRSDSKENFAYEFIHSLSRNIFTDMKFDVIIGNPPYQLSDGGHSRSASPIYQMFIAQAKKLNPRFICMITPARWYVGGKGLDDFRQTMLNDNRISNLIDYPNSNDVFPGVDIAGGISIFLWDRNHNGNCCVETVTNEGNEIVQRRLNEDEIFVRDSLANTIIRKVQKNCLSDLFLDSFVSPRKVFGIGTNYKACNSGVPCWFVQKIGLSFANRDDITDERNILHKWKFLVPMAPIAGQTDFTKPIKFYYEGNTRIAKPGECCTESWIVAGSFDTKAEVVNFKSYLFTKVVRFLLLQAVISQHVNRKNFRFVPHLGNYSKEYNDDYLCDLWNISQKEFAYINKKIKD